jgi:hypothetical protein
MLIEAQRKPFTLTSSWLAGLALNECLRRLPNVDLSGFDRVSDLFAPVPSVPARCALWHGAELDANHETRYKVYLNPQIRGQKFATDVVMAALERLDMRRALTFLRSRESHYGRHPHFVYFSLDLRAHPDARVKVYIAHHGVRASELDRVLDRTREHMPSDGKRWIRQLSNSSGPFDYRPIITCLGFTRTHRPTATMHVPIRDYTGNDASAIEGACQLLCSQDRRLLRSAAKLFACRPLETGRGLVTYVSVRRVNGAVHVTVYLAPEAFTIGSTRASSTRLKSSKKLR